MKKRMKKKASPYGMQAICMTRAAASEAVSRALMDIKSTNRMALCDIASIIVQALGFR